MDRGVGSYGNLKARPDTLVSQHRKRLGIPAMCIENFDFSYIKYCKKQGMDIET